MPLISKNDKEKLMECAKDILDIIKNLLDDEWEVERARLIPVTNTIKTIPNNDFVKIEFYAQNGKLLGASAYRCEDGVSVMLDENGEIIADAIEGAAIDAEVNINEVDYILYRPGVI